MASRASYDFGDNNTCFAYCIGNCRRDEVGSPFGGFHKQNCIFACESNHVVAQEHELAKHFLVSIVRFNMTESLYLHGQFIFV
jgi:hypothetical protein